MKFWVVKSESVPVNVLVAPLKRTDQTSETDLEKSETDEP